MVGKSCACPLGTHFSHGTCQGTPEAGNCSGGAIQYRTECLCPEGTAWSTQTGGAAQCVALQCTGGAYVSGNECVCGSGLSWDGTQCSATQVAAAAPPTVMQCPEGTIATQEGCIANGASGGTPTEPPPGSGTPSEPPPTNTQQGIQGQPAPGPTTIIVHNNTQRTTNNTTTVVNAACPAGMTKQGNTCSCPQGQVYENGRCQVACFQGQVRLGNGQCACPRDTRLNGNRCELWVECSGGTVRLNNTTCLCPSGTHMERGQCVQNPPPVQPARPAQPAQPARPAQPPGKRR